MLSNRLNTNIQPPKLSNRTLHPPSPPKPLNLPRSIQPSLLIHHNTLPNRTPTPPPRPHKQQLLPPPPRTLQPFTHLPTPPLPRLIPFPLHPPSPPLRLLHSP